MDPAVEKAHGELWRRFLDPTWHTFYDYADLDGTVILPTPEECRTDKPNAFSWDISVSNGAMFGGLYLESAINRWKITNQPEDREKARRIASGLMKLATVGKTKGFIARGVTADGSECYPLSSHHQTLPWLYGMWRYVRSEIPDDVERSRVKAEIMEVVLALESHEWKIPANRPPFAPYHSLTKLHWNFAPLLLFTLKMAADVSGDTRWEDLYRKKLAENSHRRLKICSTGMSRPKSSKSKWFNKSMWFRGPDHAAMRGLWELESDPELKAAYANGLRASAAVAAERLHIAQQFDNDDQRKFMLDWRELNKRWRKQASAEEAYTLGHEHLRLSDKLSPRRVYEYQFVSEPVFAAFVVSLCPDSTVLRKHAPAILNVIRHYRYEHLYMSLFFPVEAVYYRLKLSGVGE